MGKFFKVGSLFMGGLVLLLLLSFGLNYIGLLETEFFGVRKADIERKIFDNTKSQIQGTIQVLTDYRLQYKMTKNEGHKAALREAILMEYTSFNRKDLIPYDLKIFINSLY